MAIALNATGGIVTRGELINKLNAKYGENHGMLNPSAFYQKQLLDTIRLDAEHYVYHRLAEVSPIQGKADKLVLRRWAPLQAHTEPLTEGMPPMSDKGSVEKYEIAAAQYGRYMEFSDHVDFKIVDPVIAFYTQEYSLVALETLDLLAREALFSIANLQFAGGAANHVELANNANDPDKADSAKPSINDLRKIVLQMKKHLVKPRMNGRFQVIGSAEFFYDMIDDTYVKEYMRLNQTTSTMYDDARLVPMFEMEFYESLTVPTSGEYFNEQGKRCLLIKDSDGDITSLVDDGTESSPFQTRSDYINDPRTGMQASYIPNLGVWTIPNGATEFKLQHILVVGKDALIRTGLSGEDNAKMYVKEKGSAGVLDPIDQRQSIGFKINSVGYGSARLEAVCDYICVPSTLNY